MTARQPGVYLGVPIEDYHGSNQSISKTGLDAVAKSPAIFRARNLDPNRPPEPDRAGQLEGNLAHCALLEPDEFARRYVSVPANAPRTPSSAQWKAKDPSPSSVEAMNWWREFNAKIGNATIITHDQRETALAQAASMRALTNVYEDLSMVDILAKGHPEVSAYWKDSSTGVLCRCRPDFMHPLNDRQVVLVDVKTYSDASAKEFVRQVARKRYHVQDAFYSDGYAQAARVQVVAFVFVVVETEWPYAAASYRLDDESRAEGFADYRRTLDYYAECLKTNNWPGYSDRTQTVSLPAYAMTPQEIEISYA